MKITANEKEILYKMGQFFYEECEKDIKKTRNRLYDLHIKQVVLVRNTLIIETSRPGLLIGPRCRTVEGLKKYLDLEDICIRESEEPEIEVYMLSGIIEGE